MTIYLPFALAQRPQRRCCVLDAIYNFTCGWCNLLSTLKQYHHNSSSSCIAWQLLLITWILGRKTRSLRHIEPNNTCKGSVTWVSCNCVVQKCSRQNNTEGPLKSEPLQFVPPRMSPVNCLFWPIEPLDWQFRHYSYIHTYILIHIVRYTVRHAGLYKAQAD